MLNLIDLVIKTKTVKEKTRYKTIDMLKQYKNPDYTIELWDWIIEINRLDKISHKHCRLQTGECKIASIF